MVSLHERRMTPARVFDPSPFAVVPFEASHMRALRLQPMQGKLGAFIAEYAEKVAQAGPAWTALDDERPIACAGFTFPWSGRAVAWAVLGDCGAQMIRLTRAVRSKLRDCPAERIECQVRADFPQGLRWAEALGFAREGLLQRFYEGADFVSFALLK
jgi:hypothetical protein